MRPLKVFRGKKVSGALMKPFVEGSAKLSRYMPGTVIALLALGIITFFLLPTETILFVEKVKPHRIVFCARMNDKEEWMISYIHSVNRRPVYDYLRIEGTMLRIVRSSYDTFGAGMPETSTAQNPLYVGPDGRLEYTVNRLVLDVAVFVGRVADHTLHIKGKKIPFISLACPGETLRFFVGKRSWYQTIKGGCAWK